ncbi:MAG: RNA 2'-phosphotransferase [Candidatus Thermoplasmatota archaeon]|nr:RNA 2'-phosphotransferase [Candidatus Thermoplasmatota archaeon]
MLKECSQHGFFRNDKCPQCQNNGKFIMSDKELNMIGRIMAGVLRHFPEKFNLKMDEHGWIELYAFVDSLRRFPAFKWVKPYHIKAIVETDPKGRYQLQNNKLRATYGHTLSLELDLPTNGIPEKLYYPATDEECEIILETGIKPVDRKKVHLSKTKELALEAGKSRVERPVILEVDAKKACEEGIIIKRAGRTVYITDEVPGKYLKRVE